MARGGCVDHGSCWAGHASLRECGSRFALGADEGSWRECDVYWVAALYVLIELAFADRYGYHRDELYFLAAGRHLDWGYADQPPLVPVIARAMAAIDPNSLVLLRFPAILAVAGVIVCTGWMAREFGGGRGARALAAGVMGMSMILVGAGHLMGRPPSTCWRRRGSWSRCCGCCARTGIRGGGSWWARWLGSD